MPLASLSQDCQNVVVDVPETLPRVNVDATLLERAIANLVHNAVRYSPSDRPVQVQAGAVAGRVDLRVVDRGRGIPLPQRDLMFLPFQRLGDVSSGTGVGLGLAVAVSGFVEALGGEISVEDTPGGGLSMVISLPAHMDDPALDGVQRPPPADQLPLRPTVCPPTVCPPRPAAVRGRRGPGGGAALVTRVLVVDDERTLLRALGVHLRARGYEADLVETGEAAISLGATGHFDAAIVDLGLPGVDGIEVVEGLRGWTSIPIIVLSARHEHTQKVQALDAGADDYVTKPFNMEELLARLRAALRRSAPDPAPVAVVETPDFRIDLVTKARHRATVTTCA